MSPDRNMSLGPRTKTETCKVFLESLGLHGLTIGIVDGIPWNKPEMFMSRFGQDLGGRHLNIPAGVFSKHQL